MPPDTTLKVYVPAGVVAEVVSISSVFPPVKVGVTPVGSVPAHSTVGANGGKSKLFPATAYVTLPPVPNVNALPVCVPTLIEGFGETVTFRDTEALGTVSHVAAGL